MDSNPQQESVRMAFSQFYNSFDSTAYLGVYVVLPVCLAISILLAYALIRPLFKVKVNCWFCLKNSYVPYRNRNCWDCMHCEQYNGFTKNGDYNKPIPSQYVEELNYPQSVEGQRQQYLNSSTSLCDRCNRNQLLKVKQLAAFVPVNEDNFDSEVETFSKRLEQAYKPCRECQQKVKEELNKQNKLLKPKLINYRIAKSHSDRMNSATLMSSNYHKVRFLKAATVCAWISELFALVLLVTTTASFAPVKAALYFYPSLLFSTHILHTYSGALCTCSVVLQILLLVWSRHSLKLCYLQLTLCILWLVLYAQLVLQDLSVIPRIMTSILARCLVLLAISALSPVALKYCRHSNTEHNKSAAEHMPDILDDNLERLSSSHSDSGISGSHEVMSRDDRLPAAVEDTVYGLSGLQLNRGNISPPPYPDDSVSMISQRSSFNSRPFIQSSQMLSPSLMGSSRSFSSKASQFSHRISSSQRDISMSVRTNSSPTNLTSRHSVYNPSCGARSAVSGRTPSLYSTPPGDHLSPTAQYVLSHDPSMGSITPPMTTGYSPNGSTIYRSPTSCCSYATRIEPQHQSIIVQILLGISIGINLSIAAFVAGRYTAAFL